MFCSIYLLVSVLLVLVIRCTGMKVRVLSSYQAKNGDEISCKEGEELEVVSTDHTGWWTVR